MDGPVTSYTGGEFNDLSAMTEGGVGGVVDVLGSVSNIPNARDPSSSERDSWYKIMAAVLDLRWEQINKLIVNTRHELRHDNTCIV